MSGDCPESWLLVVARLPLKILAARHGVPCEGVTGLVLGPGEDARAPNVCPAHFMHHLCTCSSSEKLQKAREKLYTPPPSHFWQKALIRGRGRGVYILKPPAAGFLHPPLVYTHPTPRRVFSGVGGGVYKIWPPKNVNQPQSITQKGVHAHLLTAREREHWVFGSIIAICRCGFSGVKSANALLCDSLTLSQTTRTWESTVLF